MQHTALHVGDCALTVAFTPTIEALASVTEVRVHRRTCTLSMIFLRSMRVFRYGKAPHALLSSYEMHWHARPIRAILRDPQMILDVHPLPRLPKSKSLDSESAAYATTSN